MTPAEAAVLEVLKWTVNPACPVPVIEHLDEDTLVELAAYHRIEAPLLARLDKVRPAWCPPRLLTRLRIQQHQIRRQARERMAAAQEISEAMKARGQRPPIFVKGFAAYALTANPDLLHFSGDLDPFAEDLPAFWDVLHEIGYAGKRKETHEWAKLRRGEMTLDIHRHFPSLAFPADVREASCKELEARHHPGHWHLPGQASGLVPSREQIGWTDLAWGAAPGIAEGTEEVVFPSPTRLCFIHCIHCFRSSVTRLHYMDPRGGFRLCELLSVRELAHLPGFDWEEFAALTSRFEAGDAVRLLNSFAFYFLGSKIFPGFPAAGVAASTFPEPLIYGGWVSLQQPEDWLQKRGIEQMLEQIGANVLPASCRCEAADADRLLFCGDAPPLPHIEIAWDTLQGGVELDWAFPDPPPVPAEHEMRLYFGYGTSVTVCLSAEWEVTEVLQKCDYGYLPGLASAVKSAGCLPRIRVTCPVPVWPKPVTPAPALPLFLAMRRLCPNGETQAATYLPLVLRP